APMNTGWIWVPTMPSAMRLRFILTMTPSDSGTTPFMKSSGSLVLKDGVLVVSESWSSSCSRDSAGAEPQASAARAARSAVRLSMLEAPIVEHVGQHVGLVVVPVERHVVDHGRRHQHRLAADLDLDLDEVLELRGVLDRGGAALGVHDRGERVVVVGAVDRPV